MFGATKPQPEHNKKMPAVKRAIGKDNMAGLARASARGNSFQQWQADYAAHRIATFPVKFIPRPDGKFDKKPMVSRYGRFGLRASSQIAGKYPDASAIGFVAGKRNRVTIGDVDEAGEKPLQRFLDRHGSTPVIARTASGKHHVWYRHNGEGRLIRPEPETEVDILGGGLVVAPPSRGAGGEYQFIAGSLDDLDRLPAMRDVPLAPKQIDNAAPDLAGMREGDGRNNALFKSVMRGAHHVDDFDQLLDYARTQNEQFDQPLDDKEAVNVAISAWGYTTRGENRFGQHGAWFPTDEINRFITTDQDAFLLLTFLRANNGPDRTFWIANGLADTFGWTVKRLAAARNHLVRGEYVRRLRHAADGSPALYRWTKQTGQN
jgi:hypothetical protein